eukprot:2840469-Amphidinium_carterae.1
MSEYVPTHGWLLRLETSWRRRGCIDETSSKWPHNVTFHACACNENASFLCKHFGLQCKLRNATTLKLQAPKSSI